MNPLQPITDIHEAGIDRTFSWATFAYTEAWKGLGRAIMRSWPFSLLPNSWSDDPRADFGGTDVTPEPLQKAHN